MEHKWNNYHKHTEFSNLVVQDCVVKISDYIQRAKELGHDTYFTEVIYLKQRHSVTKQDYIANLPWKRIL